MTPLTVACVWVQGEYPYTTEYVRRLRDMAVRWSDRPFRFVCLTDRPKEVPSGVDPVLVRKMPGFAPWTKLELFNPAMEWNGRVLYLDLDSLIVAPLAPILDAPGPFAITADPPRPGHKTRDAYGRKIVRRFNSSVMVWDGGEATRLYTSVTPGTAARLSGDQDWIAEAMPEANMMPRAWFPRLSECVAPPWPSEAKVVLVKVPKNHVAAREVPGFAEYWGAGC